MSTANEPELLRWDRRDDAAARKRRASGKRGRRPRTRQFLWLAAAMMTVFTGMVIRREPRSDPLPPSILGMWATAAPEYAGRALGIGHETISFYRGEEGSRAYRIVHVDSKTIRDGVHLDVTYTDNQTTATIALDYHGTTAIRFTNQNHIVWRKQTPEQSPDPREPSPAQPAPPSVAAGFLSPLPLLLRDCITRTAQVSTPRESEYVSCVDAVADSLAAKILVVPTARSTR